MSTAFTSHNRLLSALSAPDLALLSPCFESVVLGLRQVLEEPNEAIEHVYFVQSGFASVVSQSYRGRGTEIGLIGREGMSGMMVVLGDDRSPHQTYMQAAGSGLRIRSDDLRETMERSSSLLGMLLHYAQFMLIEVSQTAVANGRGSVEERLARWLLMAHDRMGADQFSLTHEFLALMLGVRRAGVTVALHMLEGRGLIRSVRGAVNIIDREGLEEAANGAYGVPEAEYRRLIG